MTLRPPNSRETLGTVILGFVVVVAMVVPAPGVVTAAPDDGSSTATTPTPTPTADNLTRDLSPLSDGELRRTYRQSAPHRLSSTGPVEVVIQLHPNGTGNASVLARYGVDITARADRYVQASIPRANRSAIEALPWVKSIRKPRRVHATTVSEGVSTIDADRVHALGVHGENVTVGVIDVGFDVSNPEIASNVVDYRSFAFSGDITNGGKSQHGTAVSEVVVDVAPDASLYLANVDTMVGFASAVDWMIQQNVDVITVSLGWYASPNDGTSLVSQKATEATRHGILFVASAGNAGRGHWQGTYSDADADRWHNFDSEFETNYLNGGRALPAGRTVTITLTWNDWASPSEDYNLYLFKHNVGSQDEIVAYSRVDQTSGSPPAEAIKYTVRQKARYYLAVRNRAASGSERLELFSVDGNLFYSVASSSMTPPAVAKNATAVGAFRYSTGSLEPFSSHGPTNDGRRGLDVVGPDGVTTTAYNRPFFGTSAAAPHVAGVAALVLARNPHLSRHQVEHVLTSTAGDMGPTGPDYSTGYGRIDALGAVHGAVPNLRTTAVTVSPQSTAVGEPVTIDATVTNEGLVDGTGSVSLQIDGTVVDDRSVTLEEGASRTVTFQHTFETVGRYAISINDNHTTFVSVPSHLEFADQALHPGSSTVVIGLANADRRYYVEIVDSGGAVLGRSSEFAAGDRQTDLEISVNREITSGERLSATIRAAETDTVMETENATITASRQLALTADGPHSVAPGGSTTISFAITNSGSVTVNGVVELLTSSVPAEWTVSNVSGTDPHPQDAFAVITSGNEVVFSDIDGNETVSVTATVSVPANASLGNISIGAELMRDGQITDSASSVVSVTDQGVVDRYDEDGDGIESGELLDAITDWRQGWLTSTELLKLIKAWRGA